MLTASRLRHSSNDFATDPIRSIADGHHVGLPGYRVVSCADTHAFSAISIWVNYKTHHLNIRTYLMAGVLTLTVAGFAMMAYGGTSQATKLIGYCE